MRQQFLAREMEKAHELGADVVSLLHISPAGNLAFRKITSPELRHLGETATGVWAKICDGAAPADRDEAVGGLAGGSGPTLRGEKFRAVSTEELFGGFIAEEFPAMRGWAEYNRERYCGVIGSK